MRLLTALFVVVMLPIPFSVLAQSGVPYTVDIVAEVPGCGDEIIQSGEQCDGNNLGGQSCASVGFSIGTLSCSSACTLLTNLCELRAPVVQSGSRSPSLVDVLPALQTTNVIVSGSAPPHAIVTLLRDGQVSGVAVADSLGLFQITTVGLAPGRYSMQIVAEIGKIHQAVTDAFFVQVIADSTTKVTGITVGPIVTSGTVAADSTTIRGQAIPGALVTFMYDAIEVARVVAANDGTFAVSFPEAVRAGETIFMYMNSNGRTTTVPFRVTVSLNPGEDTVRCTNPIDITGECRVGINDFTIAVYAYVRNVGTARLDFNDDGVVNLRDFSLMAFYWTG